MEVCVPRSDRKRRGHRVSLVSPPLSICQHAGGAGAEERGEGERGGEEQEGGEGEVLGLFVGEGMEFFFFF